MTATTSAFQLRRATPADIPLLADIVACAYTDAFSAILEPAALAQRDAAFFRSHLAPRVAQLQVALRDGEPVAFTLVTGSHLDMMFVSAAARGRGAGAALLAHAESSGTHSLECFRDNHAARAFYESKGWRLTRSYEREFIGATRSFVFYEKPANA